MAYLPEIPVWENQAVVTTTFYGLNRGLVVADGEMADMTNMTGDHAPVIATRAHRRTPEWPGVEEAKVTFDAPAGMLGTDRLIICDGGALYVDGVEVQGLRLSTDEAMQPKHMVTMGAIVCIWPDKKYINLANPDDYGDMGARWTPAEGTVITAMMCRKDGREYDTENMTVSDTAPAEPEDQELWLDTSGGVDVLKQYSVIYAEWVQVATTYIKIQADGLGKDFRLDDVVHLSGVAAMDETAPAANDGQDAETLSFPAEGFHLNSSFSTGYNGSGYTSSTPTIAERTKVITVSGIPDGAVVTGAVLRCHASSPRYGAKLLTINGKSVQIGDNEIPVEVHGNGDVSLLFRFQSGNKATSSGSHAGSVTFDALALEVTYATTGSTEEQLRNQLEMLNAANTIYGAGDSYIIVAGMLRRNLTLRSTFQAERRIPDLDYVTESNNRLWGCVYKRADGAITNELRACARGDFRNWERFAGTSDDSYALPIGSDGRFTAATTVRGQPVFFKETCLHKISGTEPASFALSTTMCRGVQEGCWRSLATVGELLMYKAPMDVMAYDGTMPYSVGEKLGRKRWYEASGAAYLDKYYLSMRDEKMAWSLYVFDTVKGLWHREDDTRAHHMATVAGEMFMIRENDSPARLLNVGGTAGAEEGSFTWMVQFGVFGVTEPNQKYISRFNIRAQLARGSRMTLYIMYDSDGVWHELGTAKAPYLRTFMLPVVPRRCDHMQVMLQGYGDAKIYSIERTYETGGDGGYGSISRSANA